MRKRILALLILLVSSSIWAGEAKIPIWQGTTITTPGHYILTRDFAPPIGPGGPALTIQADGVTVDLNGHTITGQAPDPAIQIGGTAGTDKGIVIIGGRVSGGTHGIHVLNTEVRHVTLRDLTITGASDTGVKVDNLGFLEARGIIIVEGLVGFDLQAPLIPGGPTIPTARISRALIKAEVGVQCTGVTCEVSDSSMTFAKSAIRLLNAPGSASRTNTILICPPCFNPQPEPPAHILYVEDSPGVRILGNTLQGDPTPNGDNHGIYVDALSSNAFIGHNTVSGVGDNGIYLLSSDSWIMNNMVNGNGGHGIRVEGSNNLVDGNKIAGNDGDGLHVIGTHGYQGNWLLGNGSALGGTGAPDLVDNGGNQQ